MNSMTELHGKHPEFKKGYESSEKDLGSPDAIPFIEVLRNIGFTSKHTDWPDQWVEGYMHGVKDWMAND